MGWTTYFLGGLFFLVVGLYGAVRATEIARLAEQVEAMGTEPADWSVRLTQLVFVVTAVCGAIAIGLLLGTL